MNLGMGVVEMGGRNIQKVNKKMQMQGGVGRRPLGNSGLGIALIQAQL